MRQPNSRILSLEAQIRCQIEHVAKLICEGERAFDAMQVLNNLTRELVAEEVAHQTVESRKIAELGAFIRETPRPERINGTDSGRSARQG
jgi:hypothetical protein